VAIRVSVADPIYLIITSKGMNTMSEIIAQREFKVIREDGSSGTITIQIGMPYVRHEENDYWACEVAVNEFDKVSTRNIYGEDSLQALKFAVNTTRVFIEGFSARFRGRITWLDSEDILMEERHDKGLAG
jgi:hypothetical protein